MNEEFMKERPVLPLLLSMALPMILSMLVNSLYNIVDSFFVAKISEDAMTALSLVFPIQNFVNAVAIGFGVGINAVIAFYLGAKEPDKANAAASKGTLLSVVHGVIMTVVCIRIMPGFLRMFTSNEMVVQMGIQYSMIVFDRWYLHFLLLFPLICHLRRSIRQLEEWLLRWSDLAVDA